MSLMHGVDVFIVYGKADAHGFRGEHWVSQGLSNGTIGADLQEEFSTQLRDRLPHSQPSYTAVVLQPRTPLRPVPPPRTPIHNPRSASAPAPVPAPRTPLRPVPPPRTPIHSSRSASVPAPQTPLRNQASAVPARTSHRTIQSSREEDQTGSENEDWSPPTARTASSGHNTASSGHSTTVGIDSGVISFLKGCELPKAVVGHILGAYTSGNFTKFYQLARSHLNDDQHEVFEMYMDGTFAN